MANWQLMGPLDMLREGAMRELRVGEHAVLLLRVGGQYHAYQGRCPHQGGPLARGTLKDGVVTCPWHGSQFNALTGECLAWVARLPGWERPIIKLFRPPRNLTVYPVREDQGQVWIDIQALPKQAEESRARAE